MMRPKQQLFADEYLIDMNPIRAYLKVYGCKESTAKVNAYRLLEIASISTYVKEKQKETTISCGLSKEWVLGNLKEVAERCMTAVEVEKWDYDSKSMVSTGEYMFDSKGANTSLQMIGKHFGMFTDKLEVNGNMVIFQGEKDLED